MGHYRVEGIVFSIDCTAVLAISFNVYTLSILTVKNFGVVSAAIGTLVAMAYQMT